MRILGLWGRPYAWARPGGRDAYRPAFDPQLLDDNDLERLSDPTWLVEGMIPNGSRVGIYGPPGVGKTFLALNLALAVGSRDGTWLGHKVHHGSVVYLVAEGAPGLKLRVRAWKQRWKLPGRTEVRYLPEALNLLERYKVEAFVRTVQHDLHDAVVLVVIDTLSRCMEGGDENSPRDMGLAIGAVEDILRHLDCSVLLLHHPGKTKGALERGHGALRGALDTLINLDPTGDGTARLICKKQKDAEPFEDVHVRLEPVQLDATHSSRVVVLSDAVAGANPLCGSDLTLWKAFVEADAEEISSRDLRVASGLPKDTFYKSVRRLCEMGRLQKKGEGKSARYCRVPVSLASKDAV